MLGGVFPAYAGMFPRGSVQQVKPLSFPRIRGDVPQIQIRTRRRVQFSPHTRGCSWWGLSARMWWRVFPAYAGMFLSDVHAHAVPGRFPRIRGDVPFEFLDCDFFSGFSPHTRGCSALKGGEDFIIGVFPAYAGMFRTAVA